jgi:hypothetical protein
MIAVVVKIIKLYCEWVTIYIKYFIKLHKLKLIQINEISLKINCRIFYMNYFLLKYLTKNKYRKIKKEFNQNKLYNIL